MGGRGSGGCQRWRCGRVAIWSRSEVDVTALRDVVAWHGVPRTVFAEAGVLADRKSGPS
jgi:hypothetical protein